ncbi:oxidative DNA demethylase [Blyttiomyces sp. JEL0837]|nr:oxidative DNA demethylase [Blyttiomyces sp. JEL0837]
MEAAILKPHEEQHQHQHQQPPSSFTGKATTGSSSTIPKDQSQNQNETSQNQQQQTHDKVQPVKIKRDKDGIEIPEEKLSRKDFRWNLFDSLKVTGVEDRLKSQLRSHIITELKRRNGGILMDFDSNSSSPTAGSALVQKAVDSLIADHLRFHGKEFTLSVFLPESGLSQPGQMLKEADIYQVLHLDRPTTVVQQYDLNVVALLPQPFLISTNVNMKYLQMTFIHQHPSASIMVKLLDSLHRLFDIPQMDKECQTMLDEEDLIEHHLRRIDKTISRAQPHQSLASAMEDRILKYQQELDLRMKNELEDQITRYKELELARMRAEERQTYTAELHHLKSDHEARLLTERKLRTDLEESYQRKLEEREIEHEKANAILRQRLMEESSRAVLGSTQLRGEAEIQVRTLMLEKETCERRLEEAQTIVKELQGFKDRYTVKMQEAIAQYKIDLNREHANVLSNAEVEKAKVETERAILQERQRAVDQMMEQVRSSQTEMEDLKHQNKKLKEQLDITQKEKEEALFLLKDLKFQTTSQNSAATLEFEIHSLKLQLVEAEKMAEKRQEEYQTLLRDLMNPKNDVQKEMAKLRKSESKWQRECQELVAKLDLELSRNEELQRKYEDEVLKTRELRREIADLHVDVHRLRAGLDVPNKNDDDRYERVKSTLGRFDMIPDPSMSPHIHHRSLNTSPHRPTAFRQIPDPMVYAHSPHNMNMNMSSPSLRGQHQKQQQPQQQWTPGGMAGGVSSNNNFNNIGDFDFIERERAMMMGMRQHQQVQQQQQQLYRGMVAAGNGSGGSGFTSPMFGGGRGVPMRQSPNVRGGVPVAGGGTGGGVYYGDSGSGGLESGIPPLPPVEVGGEFVDDVLKSFTAGGGGNTGGESPMRLGGGGGNLNQGGKNAGDGKQGSSSGFGKVGGIEEPSVKEILEGLQRATLGSGESDVESDKGKEKRDDDERRRLEDEKREREREAEKLKREREAEREREEAARKRQEEEAKSKAKAAAEEAEARAREEAEAKARADAEAAAEAEEQARIEAERRQRGIESWRNLNSSGSNTSSGSGSGGGYTKRDLRDRESDEVRQAEIERRRAADEMKEVVLEMERRKRREEEEREREEREKEREEMKKLEALEADPNIPTPAETRSKVDELLLSLDHISGASEPSMNFGAGDTVDDISGPSSESQVDDPW